MSEYHVAVVLPIGETAVSPAKQVATLLARYNINQEVEPREQLCFCVGIAARIQAYKVMEKVLPMDTLQKQYWNKIALLYPNILANCQTLGKALTATEQHSIDALWEECIQERTEAEKEIYQAHVLAKNADPDCSGCNGTGKRILTYNPNGRWATWKILQVITNTCVVDSQVWKDTPPLVVVTADGEWHEGEDPTEWPTEVAHLLAQQHDCSIARVLCTI